MKRPIISRPYLLEEVAGSGFDLGGFLAIVLLVGLVVGYGRSWLGALGGRGLLGLFYNPTQEARTVATMTQENMVGLITDVIEGEVVLMVPTETPTRVISTWIPPIDVYTSIYTGTPIGTPGGVFYYATYSWYYPDLLTDLEKADVEAGECPHFHDGVCSTINCWDYSLTESTCKSSLANGQAWADWVGRGLACPDRFELGQVIKVSEPLVLAGDWVCVDRGYMISNDQLDFLLNPVVNYNNGVAWGSTIKYQLGEVIR